MWVMNSEMSEKIWHLCVVQWHYKNSTHFHFIFITYFPLCFVFSANVCCDIYLLPIVSKLSNQFELHTCTSVRHSGRRSEHFHFRNFQRSFVSVYKGQNTKLLNERRADFWHPREYKPAVASLHFTSGTLSSVTRSPVQFMRGRKPSLHKEFFFFLNCWDYFNDYQVLLPVFLVAVLL